jgi:hypothetical protein
MNLVSSGDVSNLHSGNTRLESRSRRWLSWLRFFMGLLSPSKQIPKLYLPLDHDTRFYVISKSLLTIIRSFNAIQCELLTASLNKSQTYKFTSTYFRAHSPCIQHWSWLWGTTPAVPHVSSCPYFTVPTFLIRRVGHVSLPFYIVLIGHPLIYTIEISFTRSIYFIKFIYLIFRVPSICP